MTFNEYYHRTVVQKKQGQKIDRTCPKCGYRWEGYPAEKCEKCKNK